MSKGKFQGKGKPMSDTSASAAYASAIGRNLPDHESMTFSPTNIVRRFDLDEATNGPSIVFRHCDAYRSFVNGWSDAGNISSQDDGSAANNSLTPGDKTLYPITPMAMYFEQDVWPVLERLFAAGVGSNHTMKIAEFTRYITRVIKMYKRLLTPVIINKLVFHTNWDKISPFSDTVPSFLYQLATNMKADDVGIAQTWLPLMKQMDTLILFPSITAECKRMLTPMLSVDLHGRVQVPIGDDPRSMTAEASVTKVVEHLQYIKNYLLKPANMIASFLPFPFQDQDPWSLPDLPLIDVDRDTGWYNSAAKPLDTFGDSGDPNVTVSMQCYQDNNGVWGNAVFFTRHTQPTWAEVKLAGINTLEYNVGDNTYRAITPHRYADIYLVDDAFDAVVYNGSQIGTGALGFRYLDYANCRFASGDVDHGIQRPGTFGAELAYEALDRMIRYETSHVFAAPILRNVAQIMAGSSLREIRWTIKDRFIASIGSTG